MKKFIKIIRGVLLCTLIVVCINGCGNGTAQYVNSEDSVSTQQTESESQESQKVELDESDREEILLYVYICGEVNHPGVYTLSEGSRVCDLFEAAGGLTAEAATDYWNQARLLVDGEMLYVPTVEEAAERQESGMNDSENQSTSSETSDTDGKINLNTASMDQLMQIPGIGEAKARSILAYREEHGGFSSIEEVMNIEGIKEGVFSKMKEYIVVN